MNATERAKFRGGIVLERHIESEIEEAKSRLASAVRESLRSGERIRVLHVHIDPVYPLGIADESKLGEWLSSQYLEFREKLQEMGLNPEGALFPKEDGSGKKEIWITIKV